MQKLSSYVVASPIFSEDNAPLLVVLATRTGAVFEFAAIDLAGFAVGRIRETERQNSDRAVGSGDTGAAGGGRARDCAVAQSRGDPDQYSSELRNPADRALPARLWLLRPDA